MSATTMRTLVERYLVERRRLGFELRKSAYALRSFACHVGAVGHRGPLTVEIMADWARCDSHGSTDPRTWARRLKLLRSFTRWLQQFEPRTEVPDDAIFGRLPERQAPHIYSEQEFVDLLAAARRLGPAHGLRGVVFETLFGLIGSCGLRVSEAVGLRNMDVDLKRGMFTITEPSSASRVRCRCTQLRRRTATLSIDAQPVGRVGAGRGCVLRRHAWATTGYATAARSGGSPRTWFICSS